MLQRKERSEIARIWARKLEQDARQLPMTARHRNLEPSSAEFLCALAAGAGARRIEEVGGSSGLSTIALAAAVRATSGRLITIEIEAERQAESRATLAGLGLEGYVDYRLGDAGEILPELGEFDFAFIDCEKEDYIRFFDLLRVATGGIVVADNILSHGLSEYVEHVRLHPGVESITLPVGKGLEVTRLVSAV
jgi:predicted O-methyltransferase YrrM